MTDAQLTFLCRDIAAAVLRGDDPLPLMRLATGEAVLAERQRCMKAGCGGCDFDEELYQSPSGIWRHRPHKQWCRAQAMIVRDEEPTP